MQSTSIDELAQKLSELGKVTSNPFFVRLSLPKHTLTVFKGGRTVVEGTTSESEAKTILTQTLGS